MRRPLLTVFIAELLLCVILPASHFAGTAGVVLAGWPFGTAPIFKLTDPDTVHIPSVLGFQLSKIDKAVVNEFQKAWWVSNGGTNGREAVVLIFRRPDGTYCAKNMGRTNQHKSFTFTWVPNAIAVVHTHPNSSNPLPSPDDIRIGDKFGVPVCTITRWGMYVYDPITRKTRKVQDNLDWLDSSKFNPEIMKENY